MEYVTKEHTDKVEELFPRDLCGKTDMLTSARPVLGAGRQTGG